jgi:hypothetical protein
VSEYLDKIRKDPRLMALLEAEAAAEQSFEMRAAFGPGVEVVDLSTRKRHRTEEE